MPFAPRSIEKVDSSGMINPEAAHNEYETSLARGLSPEDAEFLASFSEAERKAIVWKVDIRLVPMLMLLYLVAYIDKTNIGNAKIEGLLPDLHMSGTQYNIALSVFFIPYVLAEVPSNMILNKFKRPSYYLGGIICCWGIIMTLTGIVQTFAGLLIIRILLGLFEAGFFPGAILLISQWYLPNETQTRIALLYSSAASGGAFSGLLAFVIAKMDGLANLGGWRWIFIVEGIFAVVTGAACFLLLVDSPDLSSRWLTGREIRYLKLRQLSRYVSHSDEYFDNGNGEGARKKKSHHWLVLLDVLTDWKIYFLIFANWSNAVPNYAMKFTMPTIVKAMGFTSSKAQLLTIPPYACGAISAFLFSYFSDRLNWRMPFIVVPQVCIVVAFSVLFAKAAYVVDNIALCYFAVCLSCIGMYPVLPGVNAWNVSNILSPKRRSVAIAYLIAMGNVGGIIGSYIYKDEEAPRYPTGFGTSLGFASAGIIAAVGLELAYINTNKRRGAVSENEVREKYTDEELERMGERSPLYRYIL